MKILIIGNSPHSTTGYGTQIRLMCRMFQSLGHDVALLCTWGVQGGTLTVEGVPVYPTFRSMWGEDSVGATVAHFGADAVVTLHDAWVLSDGFQDKAGVPWVCISPIDSVPAAPRTIAVMKQARYPVTISRFGYEEGMKAGLKSTYIPHAVDCEVFCPGDKAEARRALDLPQDKFIAALVGANKGYPSRKAIPEQLMAFAEFHKSHPDSVLLLHTQRRPIGTWSDGIDLNPLIHNLGIQDAVIATNEWRAAAGLFADEDVANIFRASDVLMHASYAEGFGLCIAEAQACGCSVITTDFSSMPELTVYGFQVESYQKTWSLLGCWQTIPSVRCVTGALGRIYDNLTDKTARCADEFAAERQIGIDAMRSYFSIPVVTERWRTFLEGVESEIRDIAAMTATGD